MGCWATAWWSGIQPGQCCVNPFVKSDIRPTSRICKVSESVGLLFDGTWLLGSNFSGFSSCNVKQLSLCVCIFIYIYVYIYISGRVRELSSSSFTAQRQKVIRQGKKEPTNEPTNERTNEPTNEWTNKKKINKKKKEKGRNNPSLLTINVVRKISFPCCRKC